MAIFPAKICTILSTPPRTFRKSAMMLESLIQRKLGPKLGASCMLSAPAMRTDKGKYATPPPAMLARAGQKQYVLAEHMITYTGEEGKGLVRNISVILRGPDLGEGQAEGQLDRG